MPELHIGDDFALDLDRFRDEGLRAGIFASSGAGKGYLLGVIIEELIDAGLPVVMVDPESELWTFRERGAFVVGGRHGHVPLPSLFIASAWDTSDLRTLAAETIAFARSTATPVVFDLDGLGGAEITAAFEAIGGEYWRAINQDRTPSVLALTEAHLIAPQVLPRGATAGVVLPRILSGGRKRGAITLLETQRIAEIANTVIGHCNVRFIGRIDFEDDFKRVARGMPKGVTYADVQALARGTFYVPRFADGPVHVRTRRVTHGGGTPDGGEVRVREAATPKAIADLAKRLAGLGSHQDQQEPASPGAPGGRGSSARAGARGGGPQVASNPSVETGRGRREGPLERPDDGPARITQLEVDRAALTRVVESLQHQLADVTTERDSYERALAQEADLGRVNETIVATLREGVIALLGGSAPSPLAGEGGGEGASGGDGLTQADVVALIRKHAPAAAAPALMPVEALRAKYLEAAAQRLLERVRTLDPDEREALLFLLARGVFVTPNQVALGITGNDSGSTRARWNKALASLVSAGLVLVGGTGRGGRKADVETTVQRDLAPHNPTDAEVAAVRDRALYLLQGGK